MRKREDIEHSSKMSFGEGPEWEMVGSIELVLEVLLDIRDLLKEPALLAMNEVLKVHTGGGDYKDN